MKPDKFRRQINHYLQGTAYAIAELRTCLEDLPDRTAKEKEVEKLMDYMDKAFTVLQNKLHDLTDQELSPPRDPLEEEEEEEEEDEEEDESEEDEPTKAAKGRP